MKIIKIQYVYESGKGGLATDSRLAAAFPGVEIDTWQATIPGNSGVVVYGWDDDVEAIVGVDDQNNPVVQDVLRVITEATL